MNPFNERPHNLFPLRTAPYNPNRQIERSRIEAERSANDRDQNRPRTLFDVQDYLAKSDRGYLMPDISAFNKPAVENALSQDLDRALRVGDAARALRLRQMVYLAETDGFPGAPEYEPATILQTIHAQQATLRGRIEDWKRRADYDERDAEEDALTLLAWSRLAELVAAPQGRHNALGLTQALKTLEDALHFAYRDMNSSGQDKKQKNLAKKRYAKLRDVRNVIYWLFFKHTV